MYLSFDLGTNLLRNLLVPRTLRLVSYFLLAQCLVRSIYFQETYEIPLNFNLNTLSIFLV